jgi:hypothetical protein
MIEDHLPPVVDERNALLVSRTSELRVVPKTGLPHRRQSSCSA